MLRLIVLILIWLLLLSCGSSRKAAREVAVSRQALSSVRADSSSVSKQSACSLSQQLSENIDVSIIEYDTSLPVDSSTGRPPVKREIRASGKKVDKKDTSASRSEESVAVSLAKQDVQVLDSISDESSREHQETTLPRQIGGVVWAVCALVLLILVFYLTRWVRRL